MKLSELRNRLSPSNFIQKSVPVLLGATLLVSASCSNLKEFANRSKANNVESQSIADGAGVEHAYTANKKSEDDFVKLLEHKMQKSAGTKQPSRETASAPQPSVQELLAAGKDPFIDSPPAVATSAPVVTASASQVSDATLAMIDSKQLNSATQPAPRVIDLSSLPGTEPTFAPLMANRDNKAEPTPSLDLTAMEPRPFIDKKLQQTAAAEEAMLPMEAKPAVEKSLFPETVPPVVDKTVPRPFVVQAEEAVSAEAEPPLWAAQTDASVSPQEIEQVQNKIVDNSKTAEIAVPLSETIAEDVSVIKAAPPVTEIKNGTDLFSPVMTAESNNLEPSEDQTALTIETQAAFDPEISPPTAVFPDPDFCPPAHAAPHSPYPVSGFAQSTMYPAPEISGDEYIHDGGDSGTKVYYNEFSRFGLDVEDTIAEYDDDVGVAHVKASTRATVYAPKFAAVRTATLPFTDIKVVKLAGHQDQRFLAGIDTKLMIDEKTHNDEALGIRLRSRPSGIEGNAVETSLHQNVAVRKHVKLLNAYEEIRFFREGRLERVNNAIIENAIAAALDWNGDQGVNIYAHDLAGQAVQGRVTAQDYTRVEDRSKPGDLTIVKVVDKKVAKPGEELTFTIRFDNTGDRSLRNIRIVDNLSPRLVYIASSVDSDLNGKVETEDNGRGSQILTFSFEEELKGHTGGWVSFKCRVR